MSKVRITAWVSEQERAGVERIAEANGASLNVVVRVALREFMGLPNRAHLKTDQTDQTESEVRA